MISSFAENAIALHPAVRDGGRSGGNMRALFRFAWRVRNRVVSAPAAATMVSGVARVVKRNECTANDTLLDDRPLGVCGSDDALRPQACGVIAREFSRTMKSIISRALAAEKTRSMGGERRSSGEPARAPRALFIT